MRKPDEIALYSLLRERHNHQPYQCTEKFATEIAAEIGIHEKRATALLYKWDRKGWWSYGVSVRTGFFEPGAPDSITA